MFTKNRLLWLSAAILACLLSAGCEEIEVYPPDDPATEEPTEPESPEEEEEKLDLPLKFSEADYNDGNTYWLLNDEEPSTVFFNAAERSFYVNEPLQVTVTEDLSLRLRFYCPRAITGVTLWAQIDGYEEDFRLAEFEKIMPLQQFTVELPFDKKDVLTQTRSGKRIKIVQNPYFSAANIRVSIESQNPVYLMMTQAKQHWKIAFGNFGTTNPNWLVMTPVYCREAVAMSLNLAAMFSSQEFEDQVALKQGVFIESGSEVDIADLKNRINNLRGLTYGLTNGTTVTGLGGGGTYGLYAAAYLCNYVDDAGPVTTPYHELGHNLGFSHSGNMTYGGPEGWTEFCRGLLIQLGREKKLPIYSRRFLHSRRAIGGGYGKSLYPFENDPELDALDGGLSPIRDMTDYGGDDGAPLTMTVDFNNIQGATISTFVPKDVYVYGDEMYVANEAADNFGVEVFNIAGGTPVHKASIKSWQNGETTETFASAPNGIVRSNGKIYVTHQGSRTEIFDAATLRHIAQIGTGKWGEGATQTVHAFDVVAAHGLVMIRDKKYVDVLEEGTIKEGATAYVFTRSELLNEQFGTYSMAVDGDLLYATHWYTKKIDVLDFSKIRAGVTWTRDQSLTYKNRPYGVDFYEGNMYVSSDGTEKFSMVSHETGEIIEDHTVIGDITLVSPQKFCIRRGTLFIIDKAADKQCIYAIPMSTFAK